MNCGETMIRTHFSKPYFIRENDVGGRPSNESLSKGLSYLSVFSLVYLPRSW